VGSWCIGLLETEQNEKAVTGNLKHSGLARFPLVTPELLAKGTHLLMCLP